MMARRLGLVGESGSGKTTLAKAMLGIYEPDAGSEIQLDEHLLAKKAANRPTEDMRALQMVFQNPDSPSTGTGACGGSSSGPSRS